MCFLYGKIYNEGQWDGTRLGSYEETTSLQKIQHLNTVSYTIEIVLLVISTDYRISMSALAS